LLPTTFLVAFGEWKLLTGFTEGRPELEFFAKFSLSSSDDSQAFTGTTNAQVWWALLLSFPAYLWLRRFTRASVFSLAGAISLALFCLVSLLRMGLLDWLENSPDWFFLRLIPIAIIFFLVASAIEAMRCPGDSRYFYPLAVFFTFVAFSGLALTYYPNGLWLEQLLPFTRGQEEYLFIINAIYYLTLQSLMERTGSPQMRSVSKAFRFVIPGHLMVSLLVLGLAASDRWHEHLERSSFRTEARTFEILLPIVACVFVFGSISKQMKNYLAMGLVFLAIGLVRLQQDIFENRAIWPMSLLLSGMILMYVAANYPPIRLSINSFTNRFRKDA